MTPVEIDTVWVSRYEINQAKRDALKTIALMQSERIVADLPRHCILGLEAHTPHGKSQRQYLLRGGIETVLTDQNQLRQEALVRYIPMAEREEILATVYREYSQQASDAAHLRGMQTAFDVEELMGPAVRIAPKSEMASSASSIPRRSSLSSSFSSLSSSVGTTDDEPFADLDLMSYFEECTPASPVASTSNKNSMRQSPYPRSLLPSVALMCYPQ